MKVCVLCGQPIQPDDRVYQEVIGFERHRSQGGTNALRVRKLTGGIAHKGCVDKAARGIEPNQESLL